ncbi:MAG: YCF48-related protein, partial [Ignavibacteria bacterium]|nr:YCF48-related protein [Ignavibacteria bacterium]
MESLNQKLKTLLFVMIAITAILITNTVLAQQGWYKLNSPTTTDLHAVCFRNANSGCVIGENAIYKTNDGGLNWTLVQNYPFGEYDDFTFESLCYTNATTGWIAGDLYVNPPGEHHKVILKTTDAGNSWQYSYNAVSESGLMSVCYKNPYVGFSVGGDVILRSGNLGVTWEECSYPGSENDDFNFQSVCFINSLTGYVAGEVYTDPPGILRQVILKTVNSGTTWTEILRTPGTGLNSVNFCSSASGWAVGGNVLLGTVNGGQNWVSRI